MLVISHYHQDQEKHQHQRQQVISCQFPESSQFQKLPASTMEYKDILHFYTETDEELVMYKKRWELMNRVASATQNFVQNERSQVVYSCLLDGILELQESEYGFIGEVRRSETSKFPEIRLHASTTLGLPSEASKRIFEEHGTDFAFTNLETLIGCVYTTKRPVICNTVKRDQVLGCPYGHPDIQSFLGLPLYGKNTADVIGILCIANKKAGYNLGDVEFVEPFTTTGSNLIQAYWRLEQNSRLIHDLQSKIQERTRELDLANRNLVLANEKVIEASHQQLQMFACMSHEIRTPLNCIIGMADLLSTTDLSPVQEDTIEMITASGKLLLQVVNDVLDFSKLTSGNVEIDVKSTNLQETLDSVVHSINIEAQREFLALRTIYDTVLPNYIQTDGQRLQQILFNLFGNAVKFSNKCGEIEFTVKVVSMDSHDEHSTEKSDGGPTGTTKSLGTEPFRYIFHHNQPKDTTMRISAGGCPYKTQAAATTQIKEEYCNIAATPASRKLRLVVKNYGVGIKESEFENIFKPFRQASSYIGRRHGGTGLGLSITAKLVKALGGDISVNSQVGEWTEFTVDLPLSVEITEPSDLGLDLQDIQVILIDSDMKSLERLNTVFQECGIACVARASMEGLSDVTVLSGRTISMVHEELYDAASYDTFLQFHPGANLITFGPNHCVEETSVHIRAPATLLPCVLMDTLRSALRTSNAFESLALHQKLKINAVSEPNKVPVRDISKLHVLVAEDNIVNQKVIARMLNKMGVEFFDLVENGQKAVDAVNENDIPYDVILMDMQMPVMDGIQACRIILGNQKSKSKSAPLAKIIFVSANVSSGADYSTVGAWDCVPKPFKMDQIRECLQKVVAAANVNQ